MPLYPFACAECDLEFDVSRADDDLQRPASCPVDGAVARRVFGVRPVQGGAGDLSRRPAATSWGGFIHDHGPGTESHRHGPGTPLHRT